MKYINIYFYNLKAYLIASMSYRMDFFIGLISSLIEQIVYLIFLNVFIFIFMIKIYDKLEIEM